MVPAAIGTQVGGSIIRPAAYCGNFALKPTQGGLNRGERQATSMSTHGPHAGCLEDMWQVAIEIANRAGGDRGHAGLIGPSTLPAAVKPNRLIVLETEGWSTVDDATKAGFDAVLKQLREAGVTLIRRKEHPLVEALEQSIATGRAVCGGVTSWENRWYQRGIVDQNPDGVSARAKATLAKAEAMTPDDYRAALLARQTAQATHTMLARLADAAITLACPGPAPLWSGDVPGQPRAPRPTGDFVFNAVIPGTYSLTVEQSGFKTLERTGLVLTATQRLAVGSLQMAVGAVSERITVEASGATVQTTSSGNSAELSGKQLNQLMTRGRDVISLLRVRIYLQVYLVCLKNSTMVSTKRVWRIPGLNESCLFGLMIWLCAGSLMAETVRGMSFNCAWREKLFLVK